MDSFCSFTGKILGKVAAGFFILGATFLSTTSIACTENLDGLEEAFIQRSSLLNPSQSFRFSQPTDAGITDILVPEEWFCDSILQAEVELTNFGPEILEAVYIIFGLNHPYDTLFWTGQLATQESAVVQLPSINILPGTYEFLAYTYLPNGEPDPNPSNDSLETSFQTDLVEISIQIVLDQFPGETTWQLSDFQGNVLFSGGNYPGMQFDTVNYQFCVPREACFEFEIFDSFGDGICCFWGEGSYTVTNITSGAIVASGGEFRFQESTVFCTFENDAGAVIITDPMATGCDTLIEPQVIIKNYGMNDLSSVYLHYQLNNDDPDSLFWSGLLEPYEQDTIQLPVLLAMNGLNTLMAFTSLPNYEQDPNNINDSTSLEFYVGTTPLSLTIVLDLFPSETTWEFSDPSGNILFSGGPYTGFSSGDTVSYSLCLSTNCYTFTIFDSWGDGICCFWGEGSYLLINEQNGEVLAEGGNFGFEESTGFCLGNPMVTNIVDVSHIPCGESDTGGASVTVTGGSGVYSFEWSSGSTDSIVTGLSGGFHYVTVSDGFTSTEDTVFIEGGVPPTAICQDVTIYLDENGVANLLPTDVDDGSIDSCGVESLQLSQSVFDCDDLVGTTIELIVTNAAGQQDHCTSLVTLFDTIHPTALCSDVDYFLDENGAANPGAELFDDGSFDNCESLEFSINPSGFNCDNLGSNSVVLTVTDEGGNTSSCTAQLLLSDNIPPVAVCNDLIVELNSDGLGQIAIDEVDNGSFDNCELASLSISKQNFDCDDIGIQMVTLTVTDSSGNSSDCNAEVEIFDLISPEIICPDDIISTIENPGDSTIHIEIGEAIASDNCGIAEVENDYNTGGANASDYYPVGVTVVIFTALDFSENSAQCSITIEVEADESIIAICQNTEVFLDEDGTFELNASQLDGGSTGGSGPLTFAVSGEELVHLFCDDLGLLELTLVVSDAAGQSETCSAEVSIFDTLPPVAICNNLTIYLDEEGQVELQVLDIDGGSFDNCELSDASISSSHFDCSDIGLQSVVLTLADESGNSSHCTAMVTIEDVLEPIFECDDSPLILEVGSECEAFLPHLQNRISVEDNCLEETDFSFDQNPPEGVLLEAGDEISVTLSLSESGGWMDGCEIQVAAINSAQLEWLDSLPGDEDLVCGESLPEIYLAAGDFCDSIMIAPIADTIFGCAGINTIIRTWSIAGLEHTQTINFSDNIPPYWTSSLPSNFTASCDNIPDPAVLTAEDDCSDVELNMSEIEIPGSNPGEFLLVRTWTASDDCGNSITHQQFITVVDQDPPSLDCPTQIEYDLEGACDLNVPNLADSVTVWDNCTDPTEISLSQTPVPGSIAGNPTVTVFITAVDLSGNSNFCSFTLQLINEGGSSSLICAFAPISNTATEGECGAEIDLTIDWIQGCDQPFIVNSYNSGGENAGDFYPVGQTSVLFQLFENSTLLDECEVLVEVQDDQSPTMDCTTLLIEQLENPGDSLVWVNIPEVLANDNCGIEAIVNNYNDDGPEVSDYFPEGITPIEFTAIDSSGNSAHCTTTVIVLDSAETLDTFFLAGEILSPAGYPPGEVALGITGNIDSVYLSNSTGFYLFQFPQFSSFEVAPEFNQNWLDGVSTLDLILIQRAVLGIDTLANPYYIIAADANNDGAISTIDLILLQRLILGLDSELAGNTSWRFIPEDYTFDHPQNPLAENWPETRSYSLLEENLSTENWVAIKTGDVNGDAAAAGSRISRPIFPLLSEVAFTDRGIVEIIFRAGVKQKVSGVQMEFNLCDKQFINWEHDFEGSILTGVSDMDFFLDQKKSQYRVVWYHPTGVLVNEGDKLFSFILDGIYEKIEPEDLIQLSSVNPFRENLIIQAEGLKSFRPVIEFRDTETARGFELHQSVPNPTAGYTDIPFTLPSDLNVILEIFDSHGNKFKSKEINGYSGLNFSRVNLEQFPSGMYIYRLSTGDLSASKKLIVLPVE
ncbi:MAG: HYR domain-containing protein [Saprospirales bacterium]|nr:MAG: HYR domain-containing protein [Saprospirales bacterium]